MGRGIEQGAVVDSSHTTQTATLIANLLDLPLNSQKPAPAVLKKSIPIQPMQEEDKE
jgi:hypothetical protein